MYMYMLWLAHWPEHDISWYSSKNGMPML